MRVSLIQESLIWADANANMMKLHNHLVQLKGETDLVVLPEMFTTGFCVDRPDLAEKMSGGVVSRLKEWAVEFGVALCGSLIVVEGGVLYNRAFVVLPDGVISTADKRHLFSPGGEHNIFGHGDKKLIVDYMGCRIMVLVCYDIRFPVWSRNVNNEYDLLVYVANFPANRISAWDILLKARAVENICYVCGVNRVGDDGLGISYNGHSVLLDYLGRPVVACDEGVESVITAKIDLGKLKTFRERSAFWKDADQFEISL